MAAMDGSPSPHSPESGPPRPRSIAGVRVEASGQVRSVYTAMKQGLLPTELGLALLEAQAATGGLVDPAEGRLLPVSEALRRGLVGLELKERLLAAERAVTGYPDPYGDGKLALFQAIGKEVVDRALGWNWLEAQLATGGVVDPAGGVRVAPDVACQQGLLDQETWQSLQELEPGTDATGFHDPNTLERLPYSTLLRRCVPAPGLGLALLPLRTTFRSLGGAVSAAELLEVGVLDQEAVRGLEEGRLAVEEVGAWPEVRQYLQGTGGVVGVVLLPQGHEKSFSQALAEHLLPMGAVLPLLEAQAATHTLADPATGQVLWVEEAVRAGLVGPELHSRLLVAEQAVTGYPDPFTGLRVCLFQAMQKGLVDRALALRLLDAQLATGGLVCPARRMRLPLEAALHWGCLDEDTRELLAQATGFSDPSMQDSLRYGQLLARCVTDPETGLAFLPLAGEGPPGPPFLSHPTRQALSTTTCSVSVGPFRSRPVSLWELWFSEAVSAPERLALAQRLQAGTLSVQELATELKTTVEQAMASSRVTFAGLRGAVTPGTLLTAEIISRDQYEQLQHGQTTAQAVGSLASVQQFLEGTGCVAGLLLPGSQERLSVYEARGRGLLRPGTALVLLEAQAATGFVIDPKGNHRYSVEEALRAGVIGPDVVDKLLSAERAVTGYTDPYSGERISLFQAMQKDLIVRDHGIRLLEAQIATGGIIDPVHSHRVPVAVAYERGLFDEDMNLVLLDPSDDTKGFFDPNTHENLTYLQLLRRCVRDPDTGLHLLPLSGMRAPLVDGATRQALQGLLLSVRFGRLQGRRVSAWDLVNSEYVSEDRRRQLLRQFRLRRVTPAQVVQLLEEATWRQAGVTLPGLRGPVPAYRLLEAGVIDQARLDQVLEGTVSPEALLREDAGVRRCLRGSAVVGGVLLQPSGRRLSLYQAMGQKLLAPSVALALLEAQAATGAIRDPRGTEGLSVDEAVRRGLVGPELHSRLRRAEDAVVGFKDPFSGTRVSLFQAMKKGLVPKEEARRLLDAQLATGGVIDPQAHHHLPLPAAVRLGCIDEETGTSLSGTAETFPAPDGQGRASYTQLLGHCLPDEVSGLHLLPLPEEGPGVPSDLHIEETLRATPGMEDGRSLWDLLSSRHFTEEQRQSLLEDVRAGRTPLPQLQAALQRQVREAELLTQTRVTVPGPRGEVPAAWLRDAEVISQETLEALARGTQTPSDVSRLPAVKACLWGTGCVAGVLLQPSGTKATIAQAVRDGLLPPGLGQKLLEAQVASGSLVDPMTNRKLSVDEAVKAGLVGREVREQLRQAERAVTGWKDPYSGGTLSLWQAIQKGLVPQKEGLPLLQVQLATGGVMDTGHGVHLPLAGACKFGLLDQQTGLALTATDEDSKFFFDPNAQVKVTYQQLKECCKLDADTGLWLLPLPQDATLKVDQHTAVALRAMKVSVSLGRFCGHNISLWDLLNSEYVDADKRRELAALCQSGRAAALRQVVSAVTALVEAAENQPREATFQGLRKQVSATDLFRSHLIDRKTLDELNEGKRTVQEVMALGSVRQSLEGSNFIAGLLVRSSGEKMSIAEGLRRGVLRPGTALVLLEAQAATGFVIDPVQNRRLTVQQAFEEGMFGRETYTKLLSAERAVTGYTDPYSGERISLFQAMQKDLIVRDHGIRLLEAQIATGGVIDPVHSHRVPVAVAYERGYFDEDMNRVLADPSDDTKGFFDPNTHENLTYLQLLERCVRDPDTGLYLLQIVKKGEAYPCAHEAARQALRSRRLSVCVGRFAGQTLSLWELLYSLYFSEQRRQELLQRFEARSLELQQLADIIVTTLEETETRGRAVKIPALGGGEVTAAELFNSGVIDKQTLDALPCADSGQQALSRLESVRASLEGRGCIAGVTVSSSGAVMSLHEASSNNIIPAGFAVQLLEAQAATGGLLDPCSHCRLSVDKAVAAGLVPKQWQERLKTAEKAATGYVDPATGDAIPLFQAMSKELVSREEALRLLEAQVATGGVLDPRQHHRLPLDTAYQRGCLQEDVYLLVSGQKVMKRRFMDPNTGEEASYRELQERCQTQEETGWALFPVLRDAAEAEYTDEATRRALQEEQVEVTVGRLRGQTCSVWELLNSEYVSEDKRRELVKVYRAGTARALRQVRDEILQMIQQQESSRHELWFPGLRRQVTAAELRAAGVLSKEALEELTAGAQTLEEIRSSHTVRRYLEGTGCIAGVLAPPPPASGGDAPPPRTMSIYEAMRQGVLRPGTALVLLEAQAATGFVIDPVQNRRLSVEEAVAAGVVGGELREKLLSAERAVTGYTDPYSGERISLFQAMQKDLIVRDHGIRLLEAQIATGGVIDPVHSHRVPVAVAYERGYFDEDMNRVLADPSDDTKGFFDPNTHENLTYVQLLRRCVRDPDTGLFMLPLAGRASAVHQLSEGLRGALRDARVSPGWGAARGQSQSVWELLFDREVPEDLRQDLLRRYAAGALTAQEVGSALASLPARDRAEAEAADPRGALRAATMEVKVGRLRGRAVPVLDVLESGYVSGAAREELTAQFGSGTLALPALTRRLTTLIEEAEGAVDGGSGPAPGDPESPGTRRQRERELRELRAATMEVQRGQFRGRPVSLWDVLFSSYVSEARREELLAQHAAGALGLPELAALLGRAVEEAEERLSQASFRGLRRQVSVEELRASGILGAETLRDLAQGTKSLREVAEMESVRRYLEGTSCIAGVLAPPPPASGGDAPPPRTMSIYEAMRQGVLRPGTALVLLEAQAATGFVIDPVQNRRLSVEEAVAAGVVGGELREKLLSAERAVTGYTDPYSGERISLFQAMQKDLIVRDHGIRLLEAQIATGGVIDPVHSHRVPVAVAYERGYFDEDMNRVLADPSDDTKGFFDPNTHENLTYVQLLRRCVRDPDTGLFMLPLAGRASAVHQLSEGLRGALRDARVSPGWGAARGQSQSVWELLFDREVPEDLRQDLLRRYAAGALTAQEVGSALASLPARDRAEAEAADPRGALRAATMEVKVGRLRGRAVPVLDVLESGYVSGAAREELTAQFGSGTLALPALTRRLTTLIEEAEGAVDGGSGPAPGDPESPGTRRQRERELRELRAATMEVQRGQFRGRPVSLWDVLFSSYVSEARREELLAQHAAGALGLPELAALLGRAVEEAEERLSQASFRGLRRQVSVEELRASGILGAETLRDLAQGTKSLREVAEMESVRRYLEGTSCIAGVLAPPPPASGGDAPPPRTMSIYEAMRQGVLRPGTALVLLEAQAATGFVIDPVQNRRLSVEEAVAAGVVGGELREKLLSAERAVTGYTDPYSGERISLFQAMQKDLIVRDHGIRLLEAQIATGGVIDPVHSHRVPVAVAYERGYFDEDMNRVLADPSDDTKGFFDPNTHENLTYVQLLRRCVRDPDTGLFMLPLAGRASAVHQLSEGLRGALRDARVSPGWGAARGQSQSVWELLFDREVPEDLRQDLLRRYAAGALTAQEVGSALASLPARDRAEAEAADPRGALRAATMEVKVGRLRGRAVPVLDVLESGYVSGAAREELTAQFGSGTLALPALTRRLTTLIEEAEGAVDGGSGPAPGDPESPGTRRQRERELRELRAATMEVQRGQFRGRPVSLWDVLFSSYVSEARREELLAQHAAGALGLPELAALLGRAVEEAEERLSQASFRGLRRQVSVEELRASGILGAETLRDLAQGTKSLREVAEMESVRRYLEGTSCIAGVLAPPPPASGGDAPPPRTMSIYEAMRQGVLRPGTALVLLEAQAATGFVIDPVQNRRLSVEEAVAAGVVGGELREKLLSAERAVTGYTDPYSGERISLFQAMQKDLIVRDHGIRLLEAQIATGGVIDPVHSHRVPVAVAYERGYFDEDMNRVLADPSDDTKGFFDPNTHENLTYVQLLERCVRDPETGLLLLAVNRK
ncbi:epiplakin [Ochotona curzoniae]|uniref:epiplakin n=1 Tax=Ochotona curzoniae TaxID=130825 RepID=UPI001B34DCAE|nr:epiplakin [Ochotona curzoniae]